MNITLPPAELFRGPRRRASFRARGVAGACFAAGALDPDPRARRPAGCRRSSTAATATFRLTPAGNEVLASARRITGRGRADGGGRALAGRAHRPVEARNDPYRGALSPAAGAGLYPGPDPRGSICGFRRPRPIACSMGLPTVRWTRRSLRFRRGRPGLVEVPLFSLTGSCSPPGAAEIEQRCVPPVRRSRGRQDLDPSHGLLAARRRSLPGRPGARDLRHLAGGDAGRPCCLVAADTLRARRRRLRPDPCCRRLRSGPRRAASPELGVVRFRGSRSRERMVGLVRRDLGGP